MLTNASQTPLGFVGYHSAGAQDWRNLNLERAVSSRDVKFQFNTQLSYDLPIGKGRLLNLQGKADSLLGGWTLNGIVYPSTGVPIASPTGTPTSISAWVWSAMVAATHLTPQFQFGARYTFQRRNQTCRSGTASSASSEIHVFLHQALH